MTTLDRPTVECVGIAADHVAMVEIVVPVYNEERDLETSIRRLVGYLRLMPFSTRVTIADNGSTDATAEVAGRLARVFEEVEEVHLAQQGRGHALRHTWLRSRSSIVAYMDVDLSTDLNALLPVMAPLLSGHSDVAIGSRLSRGSRVRRGRKRDLISRSYNLLLHATLRTGFADAQCGFKALRRDVALQLVPLVRDDGWFFDTELLVLAERSSLRIHEVPVDWLDDPTSTVDVVRTAMTDLRGIARLAWTLATGRIALQPLASGAAPVFLAQDHAYAPSSLAWPASPSSNGRKVSTMTASSSKYSTPIERS